MGTVLVDSFGNSGYNFNEVILMPRQARNLGNTGWAHIIVRGINRENLFYDAEDYDRFNSTVERYQKECGFEVAILCLMSNHVHILLKEENGNYATLMKKIAVSYASYYNKKYERVGHIFQDRFLSEPVNDEAYFLTVLRYIYKNPEKAGICPAADYPYSRFDPNGILRGYFYSEAELRAFLEAENDDCCLEYNTSKDKDDAYVLKALAKITGSENPFALQSFEKSCRDAALRELKQQGISVRCLSRLTGINRNIVQRA